MGGFFLSEVNGACAHYVMVIGSAEALPILCVRSLREVLSVREREREREREIQRERERERERRK